MTKKKRELIDLMFEAGITPETWPKKAIYACQDKETLTWGKSALMFYTNYEVPHVREGRNNFVGEKIGPIIELPELCHKWNKTIVHRDEFMKRWNECIHSDQTALLRESMPPCSEEIPCRFVNEKSPLETQIGGDHYTKPAIQPMQYSMKNKLDPLQHTIIKYVTRFRDKAGIEDLEKAKHCIDMLIEFEKESK